MGFRWDLEPREGCSLPSDKPFKSWPRSDRPCRRAEPESLVDHYEEQGEFAAADGVSTDGWNAAARAFYERRKPSPGG